MFMANPVGNGFVQLVEQASGQNWYVGVRRVTLTLQHADTCKGSFLYRRMAGHWMHGGTPDIRHAIYV